MSKIIESIRHIGRKELRDNPSGMSSKIDAEHFIPVKDNFFSQLELTQIKKQLYEVKEEEFKAAQIFAQTSGWDPGIRQIGYDILESTGEARVGATGAKANDIPFIGEKLQQKLQSVVEIEIGIEYTRNEIEAVEAKNKYGRGAELNLVEKRGAMARRAISRIYDKLAFQGSTEYDLTGVQSLMPNARQSSLPTDNNTTFYEGVPDTGTGSTTAKRLWANKTGQLIYNDLLRGKFEAVQRGELFQGDQLIVDSIAYRYLAKPYSDLNNQTLINYITQGNAGAAPLFKKVWVTNAVAKANNGRSNTYGIICDASAEFSELPVLRPITVFPSKEEWNGDVKQLVAMRFGGFLNAYPGAFYFFDGHVEAMV